jgi:hypothetical protein
MSLCWFSANEERSFRRSRPGRRRIWHAQDSWPPLRSQTSGSTESAGFELQCLSTGFRRSHTKYASSFDDSDGSTTQHHIRRYCNAICVGTHARRCLRSMLGRCDSYPRAARGCPSAICGSSHDVLLVNHDGMHLSAASSSYRSSAANRCRSSNTICRCVWPRKPRMPMPCSCDSARETVSSVRPR